MTRLPLPDGPTTFPACRCGTLMERRVLPENQDRPRVSYFACPSCGRERDHTVTALPPGGLAGLRAAKKLQMEARLARVRSVACPALRTAGPVMRLRTVEPDPVKLDSIRRGLAARPSLYVTEPTC